VSHSWLLATLLALLVVEPFLSDQISSRWVFDVMVSAVLLAAVWAVGRGRRSRLVGLLLAAPALVVEGWLHVAPSRLLAELSLLFALGLLVYTAIVVLRHVLESRAVTWDTVAGALSVYLLLGVISAMTFALVELTHPGSYLFGGQPLAEAHVTRGSLVPQFLYLSFVTLTTLGYGDVLPVTAVARRITVLEAVIGQIYLAVLIARLVALQVSPSDRSAPPR
jgi:hypothetical protein